MSSRDSRRMAGSGLSFCRFWPPVHFRLALAVTARVWRVALPALLLSCHWARAETIRVAALDVRLPSSAVDPKPIPEMLGEAAATLRELNPDVILVHGVKDWQTCEGLVEALKPIRYVVASCSSFSDPSTGKPAKEQSAILSRQKPYFHWSESWRVPSGRQFLSGGYAFIALQRGKQRLGFYCIALPDDGVVEAPVQQFLSHLKAVKSWEANSVELAVASVSIPASIPRKGLHEAVALLEEGGFANACFDLPFQGRISGDGSPDLTTPYLLAERSASGTSPREFEKSGRLYIASDLELDSAKVAASWSMRAQEFEHRSLGGRVWQNGKVVSEVNHPALTESDRAQRSLLSSWWVPVATLVVLLGFGIWLRRIRRPLTLLAHSEPALLARMDDGWRGGSSYTVVISPQSVSGPGGKDAGVSAPPQPVVHLEAPSVQTHSANRGCPARNPATDELSRARLLSELGRWLKLKLVRGLIADRRRLLLAQETAGFRAKAIDERLAGVEQKIQSQRRDYERRIEELTRVLVVARDENRELIQTRIAQIKFEMEALRARTLAESQAKEDTDPHL